ncbi:MAG TPA: hypothetical protein PL098_00055 [Brevundimonas diminuta]|nr:hypothetical protein [Brevundimonas diminuta]HRL23296.1 hypothetical protein [Brevundimonas diminuta]
MTRAIDINTEARAKSQAAFPVGATVRLKHGGAPMTVLGHTSKGHVVCEQAGGATTAARAETVEVLP